MTEGTIAGEIYKGSELETLLTGQHKGQSCQCKCDSKINLNSSFGAFINKRIAQERSLLDKSSCKVSGRFNDHQLQVSQECAVPSQERVVLYMYYYAVVLAEGTQVPLQSTLGE